MIRALRYIQFNRCAYKSKLLNFKFFVKSSGIELSSIFISNRLLHDGCPSARSVVEKHTSSSCKSGSSRNSSSSSINCSKTNAKKDDCDNDETPPPNPNNSKLLLALLAAGGIAGLLYWMSRGDKKNLSSGEGASIIAGNISQKIPASSADLPKHVPYLLIGGGTASFSAFRAIKSHDPKAKVLVISNEYHKPYMRPPLSKELWYNADTGSGKQDFRFKQWNGAERSLFYEPDEFYMDPAKLLEMSNGGVAVAHGYTVKRIDPCDQEVTLTDGTKITYDKCLIATGCTPKNIQVFASAPKNIQDRITQFRGPVEFEDLKKIADTKKSITVVGSGFLGSELACAISNYGKSKGLKVNQIFHENGNMAKVIPEYLSKWTTNCVQKQGVCVIPEVQIIDVSSAHNNIKLTLSNGQSVLTDHVVVCAGCEPNTQLGTDSGLEINNSFGGFVVNAELEARRNLFVAGDVACFYDPLLGRRRVEHHDHSVVSGRLAGENMSGQKKPYKHQSMFWSDLGPEVGYEGIGLIDSSLPTVGVFAKVSEKLKRDKDVSQTKEQPDKSEKDSSISPPQTDKSDSTNEEDDYGKGVIFYLKNDKIVGVLLWNIFNRISLARQIINENKKYEDLNEVAKLFEIHA